MLNLFAYNLAMAKFIRILMSMAFYCLVDAIQNPDVVKEDYCTSDTFEPECPEGNVIFIETALYGRMHASRCITSEYGVGCQADVTTYLADKCSGRRRCSVVVGTLYSIVQPCDKDFNPYLQASHRCIHVKYAKPCHRGETSIPLIPSHGFIAPYADSSYAIHGAELCAWEVRGQPGQRINITVNNLFTLPTERAMYSNSGPCPVRITVMERNMLTGGNLKNTYELCDDSNTPRIIYTSQSHIISIQIPYNARQVNVVQKLLKYEVYGCPNIEPSQGSHVKREGDNIAIICNATMETWYLTCKDGHWVGEPGNCSFPHGLMPTPRPKSHFRHGITLAIVVGVALGTFMGACMLCLVYVVRKSGKRHPTHHESLYASDIQYEPGMHTGTITATATLTTAERAHHSQPPQNQPQRMLPGVMCQTKQHHEAGLTEYTHVWGVHPPSICTERQYSSSTFNPNYDHSNCVPLQNYESSGTLTTTTAAAAVTATQGVLAEQQQQGTGGKVSAIVTTTNGTCVNNKNNTSINTGERRSNSSISSANLRNINSSHLQDELINPLTKNRSFFCELHGNV